MTKNIQEKKKKSGLGEMIRTIIYAVLIAGVIRSLAFEPFNIPSESMLPSLLVGDYLFISKYSYGYSKHSFPWSPDILSGRIFEAAPKRGDIAVFKLPRDNSTDYIKRILGLPGDRIQMTAGALLINGKRIKRERVGDFAYQDGLGNIYFVPQYREILPGGASYLTLDLLDNSDNDDTPEYLVPAGYYFALGDNRDNSLDSRVTSAVGFIPKENLVGRAETLFFSVDGSARFWEVWKWPFAVRYNRLFHSLRT